MEKLTAPEQALPPALLYETRLYRAVFRPGEPIFGDLTAEQQLLLEDIAINATHALARSETGDPRLYLRNKGSLDEGWIITDLLPDFRPRQDEAGNRRGWQSRANCLNAEERNLFFEAKLSPKERAIALSYCLHCPVKTDCLESGLLEDEKFGVWGGLMSPTLRNINAARKKFVQEWLTEEHRAVPIGRLGLDQKMAAIFKRTKIATVGDALKLSNKKFIQINGFELLMLSRWNEKLIELIHVRPEDLDGHLLQIESIRKQEETANGGRPATKSPRFVAPRVDSARQQESLPH